VKSRPTARGAAHAVRAPARKAVARVSRERGQGTVEYVALIALVALVMVGAIAAMKSTQLAEGQQLGGLILKKIEEAVGKVHY
jgi:Flp pilus assembly pilin Flp